MFKRYYNVTMASPFVGFHFYKVFVRAKRFNRKYDDGRKYRLKTSLVSRPTDASDRGRHPKHARVLRILRELPAGNRFPVIIWFRSISTLSFR